jgi:UPF0042 nucleotide-binding protein
VLEGVTLERERLSGLRASATRIVDTTALSVHELRRTVRAQFGPASGTAERMTVRVVSFGFKYGTPVDADLVLDVRFLKNPYFEPALKHLPGTDPRGRDYVLGLPETPELLGRTLELLEYVIPKYGHEGKSYLTIAFGCTGGMHRSVVMAEEVARALDGLSYERASTLPGEPAGASQAPAIAIELGVVHRDVERNLAAPTARAVGDGSVPPPPRDPAKHGGRG